MDLGAPLIRHVLYPLWARKIGSSRLRVARELERSQFQPAQVLRAEQFAAFQKMFRHAYDHCEFYRERYEAAGLQPEDIRTPEDVARVPTITKEEIQQNRERMISRLTPRDALIPDMTGGSTGSPLAFYYDKARLDSRIGATLRHNAWAGWRLGDRAAVLWGAPQDLAQGPRLKDRIRDWIIDRRLLLDASRIDDARMHAFADALREYRPRVMQAYSNTLALFARFVRDNGITGIRPKGIVCSAELLTAESRALIESTFQCPVFDRYGCREFAVVASECARHRGLHINEENLLVESVDERGPALDRDGEIVVTDLRNFAMPMIRYRIRDVGRVLSAQCDCGRGLSLMQLSGGRTTDFLTSTSGAKVSGIVLATYVITNLQGVRQIQFVQASRNAVTIRVASGPDWQDSLADALADKARHYLGADMRIEFDYVERIESEKSGKFRFSICTI
jgi:phenylacetate-CoA ligase